MQKRKKYWPVAIISIASFFILGYCIMNIDPTVDIDLLFFSLSPIIPVSIALLTGIFSLFFILLLNIRRALLITIYAEGVFLLRYLGYKSWVHIAFLFIILVLIELFFSKK